MAINVFKNVRETIALEPEAVLFRQGDDGDVMYAILEGEIRVEHDGRVLETLGTGEILGELALIDRTPRTASAVAHTPARVVRVDRDRFMFLVQEHPTFALQVMAVMAERLRRANDQGAAAR